MTYTEEMTTSEILLRLASMRNELLQAVNDIEKISKNISYKTEQTEPQFDKDINVRSKTEPQIQLTARCLNCNNAKACKENHWEDCLYEPKDEKTCESCRHWKYIAKEWQCEAYKCQGYEPKDEPQTENLFTDRYGDVWEWRDNAWYCISGQDEPQTDCAWK